MGQYFYTVNISKKEFLHPHAIGDGLKLWEQMMSGPGGIGSALIALLSTGETGDGFEGRWAGDRVYVAGDYGPENFMNKDGESVALYFLCNEDADEGFTDITPLAVEYFTRRADITYSGDGWVKRSRGGTDIERAMRPDGIFFIPATSDDEVSS